MLREESGAGPGYVFNLRSEDSMTSRTSFLSFFRDEGEFQGVDGLRIAQFPEHAGRPETCRPR